MKPALTANDLTAQLLIEIPRIVLGARVWRRNVGRAVGLDTIKAAVRAIKAGQLKAGIEMLQHRPVTFGVAGEGDIDGIVPINGYGVRVCVEVKFGRDPMREAQVHFQDMIRRAGGVCVIARSLEQGLADLQAQVQIRGEKT